MAVFLPLASAALGGVLSILVTLWVVTRTEWYRRLARWEPYGEKLWEKRTELYWSVCQSALEAMLATHAYVYNARRGEPEHNKPFVDDWTAKDQAFRAWQPQIKKSRNQDHAEQ